MAQGWGITELMVRLIRFLINWPVYFHQCSSPLIVKSHMPHLLYRHKLLLLWLDCNGP